MSAKQLGPAAIEGRESYSCGFDLVIYKPSTSTTTRSDIKNLRLCHASTLMVTGIEDWQSGKSVVLVGVVWGDWMLVEPEKGDRITRFSSFNTNEGE